MTTREVADKLVGFCLQGENLKAEDLLYHPEVVSVEANGMEVKGLDAVKGKTQWFLDNHEIHSAKVAEYYVGHNSFSVIFEMEVTPKGGQRTRMKELGVYTVADGKIVHEQFQNLAG